MRLNDLILSTPSIIDGDDSLSADQKVSMIRLIRYLVKNAVALRIGDDVCSLFDVKAQIRDELPCHWLESFDALWELDAVVQVLRKHGYMFVHACRRSPRLLPPKAAAASCSENKRLLERVVSLEAKMNNLASRVGSFHRAYKNASTVIFMTYFAVLFITAYLILLAVDPITLATMKAGLDSAYTSLQENYQAAAANTADAVKSAWLTWLAWRPFPGCRANEEQV